MAISDNQRVVETTTNFLAQLTADRVKKPAYSNLDAYKLWIEQLNAVYATGVFDPSYTADQAFAEAGAVFNAAGFVGISTIMNAQEGDGAWAEFPIVYVTPP